MNRYIRVYCIILMFLFLTTSPTLCENIDLTGIWNVFASNNYQKCLIEFTEDKISFLYDQSGFIEAFEIEDGNPDDYIAFYSDYYNISDIELQSPILSNIVYLWSSGISERPYRIFIDQLSNDLIRLDIYDINYSTIIPMCLLTRTSSSVGTSLIGAWNAYFYFGNYEFLSHDKLRIKGMFEDEYYSYTFDSKMLCINSDSYSAQIPVADFSDNRIDFYTEDEDNPLKGSTLIMTRDTTISNLLSNR